MKKAIAFFVLCCIYTVLFAQNDSIVINDLRIKITQTENNLEELTKLSKDQRTIIKTLEREILSSTKDFNAYKSLSSSRIDSLILIVNKNSIELEKASNELGQKIAESEKETSKSISILNESINKSTLLWVLASLVLAIFLLVTYIILKKQIFKQKSDLVSDIQNTRKNLEEEDVKLDNKLIEVLESQLKIVERNKADLSSSKDADHTLALKVADEIIRIQKNLTRMDEKTKGLKQLSASVRRIQDNFASNGYELVEMLGQPYNEGMKVSANFIPDENMEKGKQIITRIIKPQVNFQGVMIQSAQIEVSQGE